MSSSVADQELFSQYLGDNHILIADQDESSRSRLANVMVNLGAKQERLLLAKSVIEAKAELERASPRVILSDYSINRESGLTLLPEQRKRYSDPSKCFFALITSDWSQASVARAAEEDVDAYVLKPFTQDGLKNQLIGTAIAKLYPSQYHRMLEAGKKHLIEGKPDKAIPYFDQAVSLSDAPALAYFYLGQANQMKNVITEAEEKYRNGLNFNAIHYKCLTALYELLFKERKLEESYAILKRIAKHFPANPLRIASVLALAIRTGSFDDVEEYYDIFKELDCHTDQMIRHVCSALIVSARHYIAKDLPDRAKQLLRDAIGVAAGHDVYVRYAIEAMLDAEMIVEAREGLERFDASARETPDFLSAHYLVTTYDRSDKAALERGRDLLRQGITLPPVYRGLVRHCYRMGLKSHAVELAAAAVTKWPGEAPRFNALAKEAESSIKRGQ